MKVVVVGASGILGSAVVAELEPRHEIVRASRSSGDLQLDCTDTSSIRAAFEKIGTFDALVATTGKVEFAPLAEMTSARYQVGLRDKLMGQVDLVLIGREFVRDGGSFTLTTGILDVDPIRLGSSAAMVNGAVNAFVRAAAVELPRGLRINSVGPGVIAEAMPQLAPLFRGFEPVPAARAALAYARSVEGAQTGQVYRVA